METELVSVIIAAYNVEKYIKKCIDSLLKQTYSNIEVIVINDGSQDRTEETICKSFDDKRIVLLSKENGGVSSARNLGLKKARGKYVFFVDADDWCDQDYIERSLEAFITYDSDIVLTSYYTNNDIQYNTNQKDTWHEVNLNDALTQCLEKEHPIFNTALWNKAFKRDIIIEKSGEFDCGLTIGEDMDFLVRYLLCCKKFYYSLFAKYHYVTREDSAVATVSMKNLSVIDSHQKILNYDLSEDLKKTIQLRLVDSLVVMMRILKTQNNVERKIVRMIQASLRKLIHDTGLYYESSMKNKLFYFLISNSVFSYTVWRAL